MHLRPQKKISASKCFSTILLRKLHYCTIQWKCSDIKFQIQSEMYGNEILKCLLKVKLNNSLVEFLWKQWFLCTLCSVHPSINLAVFFFFHSCKYSEESENCSLQFVRIILLSSCNPLGRKLHRFDSMQSIHLNSIVILLLHRMLWLVHDKPTNCFHMNFYVQWTPRLSFILFCLCVHILTSRSWDWLHIPNLSPSYQTKWLDKLITRKRGQNLGN